MEEIFEKQIANYLDVSDSADQISEKLVYTYSINAQIAAFI